MLYSAGQPYMPSLTFTNSEAIYKLPNKGLLDYTYSAPPVVFLYWQFYCCTFPYMPAHHYVMFSFGLQIYTCLALRMFNTLLYPTSQWVLHIYICFIIVALYVQLSLFPDLTTWTIPWVSLNTSILGTNTTLTWCYQICYIRGICWD